MDGDLRVVRAGLDAQVAARPLRVEVVTREVGQGPQCRRPARRKSEAIIPVVGKQTEAESEGEGQPRRSQAVCLAGVLGWCEVRAVHGAELADVEPLGHVCGGGGPGAQQLDEIVPRVRGHIERGEVEPILGRGDDAGLMRAVELDDVIER